MKKSLFLLPLLAAFALCGCGDNGGGGTGGGGSGGGGGGGGGGSGGGGGEITGELLGTVTLSKNKDMGDPGVFEKGNVSVVIEQGECAQTVEEAAGKTGNYEFRVYAHMLITFSANSNFSQLLIKYSSHTEGTKTYYFDYEEMAGATNEFDNDKCEAVVTLDNAAKSYTFDCWHQTRIASVSFYA